MERTRTICLVVLTTIAVGYSLYFLQTVLLPFVIAIFVVIGCKPILEALGNRGIPRLLAFGLTFCAGALSLAALCYTIFLSVASLSSSLPAYKQRLDTIVDWYEQRIGSINMPALAEGEIPETGDLGGSGTGVSGGTGVPGGGEGIGGEGIAGADSAAGGIDVMDANKLQPPLAGPGVNDTAGNLSGQVTVYLQSLMVALAGGLSSLLSYSILILIFVYFLLFGDSMHDSRRPEMVVKIEAQIRKFLVIKTLISAITGIVFGAILWLFGVPLAIVFGLLAFLLNYIPNIGPLVAIVLPLPFLVLNSDISPLAGGICFVLISTVQFVSGNVIETNLMGKSFDVSPVVLLLALMFFGLVWGVVGMFVATPLVSIAKIVLEATPQGKGLAELIAGRWS